MAEVTYPNNMAVGTFLSGSSKGMKVIGISIKVDDDETLSMPLRIINSVSVMTVENTAIDAATKVVFVKSVAAGVITFLCAEIDTYGDSTDVEAYVTVVGLT